MISELASAYSGKRAKTEKFLMIMIMKISLIDSLTQLFVGKLDIYFLIFFSKLWSLASRTWIPYES